MRESGNIERWRTIRQAAIRLFDKHGYTAVSIDQIAEEAGVSRRTFFNYFPTKAAALFEPAPDERIELEGFLQKPHDGEHPWRTIERGLTAFMVAQSPVIAVRRRIISEDPSLDARLTAAYAEFDLPFRAWLVERLGDNLASHVMGGVAMTLTREAYMAWNPEDGLDALRTLIADAFALAANGMQNVST